MSSSSTRPQVPTADRPKEIRIQSLARADAILGVVLGAPSGSARLGQIAAALGLNKTTVFNLAESLIGLGYLARDESGRGYVLGYRNLELGRAVTRSMDLLAICRASLIHICRETLETVNLALPYVNNALIVESYEGSHGIRATSYAGTRAPYHATACGKAMLAYMTANARQQLYDAVGLPASTRHTIISRDLLEKELQEVRRLGFATENEESEIGASCVAMVILDAFDQPIASISVAGVTQRMTPQFIGEVVAVLTKEIDTIRLSILGPISANGA